MVGWLGRRPRHGRTLARRRERLRGAVALPPPHGIGLLLPRHARANEAFAGRLAAAWDALARALVAADRARAARLREDTEDAVGAWRLGEMEGGDAAAAIEAAIGPPTAMRPVLAEELPALRAAS